jgi:hypothetical protein
VGNSPDVVEAEQTLVKAKAAARLSKLDYVPSVGVVGGYLNQTQPPLPLLPNDFSFIGFTGTLNIFDFGKREKTISERNAQVGLAEANVALVKSKVAANVQKTFLDLQRTQKIRELARRLAATYQEASLENTSARAAAEAAPSTDAMKPQIGLQHKEAEYLPTNSRFQLLKRSIFRASASNNKRAISPRKSRCIYASCSPRECIKPSAFSGCNRPRRNANKFPTVRFYDDWVNEAHRNSGIKCRRKTILLGNRGHSACV